jgi:tripartite-type tricarboxylate transporter receptor subunit TctC
LGLGAPAGINKEVASYLEAAMAEANKDPNFISRLNQIGMEPSKVNSANYQNYLSSEIKSWAKIIQSAGIKPE